MQFKILNRIGISILLIGFINLFNIVKYGVIFNFPSTAHIIGMGGGTGILQLDRELCSPILGTMYLDNNNIKIIIFISILIFTIFNLTPQSLFPQFRSKSLERGENSHINSPNSDLELGGKGENVVKELPPLHSKGGVYPREKRNTVEYEVLIGFGLIGLIFIIISKDLISLYLGIELYSFSTYILILVKESITIRKISIIYLILSSIASALLLYSFYIIYRTFGMLDIDILYTNALTWIEGQNNNIILYLILLGLLFKLGAIPFSFWVIRLYQDLDKRILWYQLTVPKFVFFLLLLKFINIFYIPNEGPNLFFPYFIFGISILSIILGGIGGLFQNRDNLLLSYSSILNIGFILLPLSLLLFSYPETFSLALLEALKGTQLNVEANSLNLNLLQSYINKGILGGTIESSEKIWTFYQYFIIYILNLIGLFSAIFLFSRSSLISNYSLHGVWGNYPGKKYFFSYPFFFISFLIIIFSFIGLPPFSGFFSKFYLLFTLYSYSLFTIISYTLFILFTLISSFFYFKFLFTSSSQTTPGGTPPLNAPHHSGGMVELRSKWWEPLSSPDLLIPRKDLTATSIVLAFSTLFIIFYPFFISYLLPFYFPL